MKLAELTAIFLLARINVKAVVQIPNEYWPESYTKLREDNPWWKVTTDLGVIKIGWRKRVIEIDWSETNRRGLVTTDDVTKSDHMVHAYNHGDAVKYLSRVSRLEPIATENKDV